MPLTLKQMIEAANTEVPKIGREAAEAMIAEGALLLDVRDAQEVVQAGKVPGAHHVSRGMLEFRADVSSPFYDPEFRTDRAVILYCGAGGRAALAGKVLKEMGFAEVHNLGGFKDWMEAGHPVEHPMDKGM